MKKILIILLFTFNFIFLSSATSFNGSWEGRLKITPEMSIRVTFNFNESEGVEPSATMDSPDQGAYGIPVKIDFINSDSIAVSQSQLNLKYTGRLKNDTIEGHFSQGFLSLPLILTHRTESLSRPQTPVPPFPYLTQEVSFPSALDNANLYGTVSIPSNSDKNIPFVVFVSGSGLQNRDEEIFGHKPFAVIADFLSRNGIGSLRYDDRGFDRKTGLEPNADTYENAMDALGAINYLQKEGYQNIGMLGHSEGGLIADIIACKNHNVKFVVEIGGPSVSGDTILLFQNEFMLKDGKLPEEYVGIYLEALKGIFDAEKTDASLTFNENDYEIFSENYSKNPVVSPLVKNLREIKGSLNPWLIYFINYDPKPDIAKIEVSALFIYGENDTQVPPFLNVSPLESLNPNITVKIYPELNHLMQHSVTGKINEYSEIEETISPEVLEDIKEFILTH